MAPSAQSVPKASESPAACASKAGDKHLDIACFQRLEIIGDKKGQKTLRRRLAATTRSDRQLRNPRLFSEPQQGGERLWTTFRYGARQVIGTT